MSTNTPTTMFHPNDVYGEVSMDAKKHQDLLTSLETMHIKPLWAQRKRVNPPLPNPTAVPYIWRYENLRPRLMDAGELVNGEEAERRIFMLINPKKGAYMWLKSPCEQYDHVRS